MVKELSNKEKCNTKPKRKSLNAKLKKEIGTECCNCGETKDLQYHHIVPVSLGGKDEIKNMCCLCHNCHIKVHFKGKGAEGKNYGEMIKIGQAAAIKKGEKIGRIPNEIILVRKSGEKIIGSSKYISELLGIGQRSIELMCKTGATEFQKNKYDIDFMHYRKIIHNSSKVEGFQYEFKLKKYELEDKMKEMQKIFGDTIKIIDEVYDCIRKQNQNNNIGQLKFKRQQYE